LTGDLETDRILVRNADQAAARQLGIVFRGLLIDLGKTPGAIQVLDEFLNTVVRSQTSISSDKPFDSEDNLWNQARAFDLELRGVRHD
jgi:hypothetical protein